MTILLYLPYIYVCECVCERFTQPLHLKQDVAEGQFLIGVNRVWIPFSFSLTGYHAKVKKLSLPYYLPITGGELLDSYFTRGYQR